MTIDIHQTEGWPVGREMEAMIASPWYEASGVDTEELKEFYARHSPTALALCFDIVETKSATYLGLFIPHTTKDTRPRWKPKPLPRFAFRDPSGPAWSLVGPGLKNLSFEIGAPLDVVIGRQSHEERQAIIHVGTRHGGECWDCLGPGSGVFVREASAEKPMKIIIADLGEEVNLKAPANSMKGPCT